MKVSLRYLVLCLLLLSFHAPSAHAQWEQITSFQGGNPTTSLAESTNKLVGIGSTGLYLADKTERIWQEVPLFNQITMYSVAASNDTLFVVHRGFDTFGRLYLSASYDEGVTWETSSMIAQGWGGSPLVAYVNEQLIVAGTMDGSDCLRKSLDFGQTWITEIYPTGFEFMGSILDVNETHIVYHVLNSIDTSEVYSYDVALASWHAIPNTSDPYGFPDAKVFNNRIYTMIGASGSVTIYSTAMDGSDSQTLYSNSDIYSSHGFFESDGRMVLILKDSSTPNGDVEFHVSTDTAQTFTFQNTFTVPNNMNFYQRNWPLDSGELIVGGERLYLIPINFQSYEEITDGFVIKNVDYLASINSSIYALKGVVAFGKSENNGLSFEDISANNNYPLGGILHRGDTIFYVTAGEQTFYSFNRSYDNGATYESFPFGEPDYYIGYSSQKSAFLNNKIYILLEDLFSLPILLMSADFGETWTTIPLSTTWPGILHIVNGSLYLFGEDLYRFDEQNNTWTDLNSSSASDIDPFISICKMRTIGNNLWMLNDENVSALLLSDGVTMINSGLNIYDVTQIGNIVYGLSDSFILASSDFGLTWVSTGIQAPPGVNTKMESHESELFIYGGYNTSIWKIAAPQFITGKVYYDANSNGIYETGEPGVPNVLIHSQNSDTYAMSGLNGSFLLNYNGDEDQITVEIDNNMYTATPETITSSGIDEVFFGIQVNGTLADLQTDAVLISPFRPGFSTSISVMVRNLGNVIQGGELSLTLPEQATFTNASLTPSSETDSTVTWSIGELNAFETRYINLQLLSEVSAILGDTAVFELNITAANSDDNLENNSVTNASIIVGAYDPNDKACSRGEIVTPTQLSNSNEFEYLIRFQNTGTFYAENVVIQDTISSYFDLATMRIIASSDTMNVTFGENNLVNFNFPLIFLPDSTTNEPESHGFVKYAIRTKPDLQLGTYLRNTAYIYFDFNEPIITNTAETLFDLTIGYEMVDDRSILVYPNPTTSTVQLMEYANQTVSVSLNDISGKAVALQMCLNGELDLSKLNPGIYLGVISASQGQPARRFKVVKM
jgi:hypothetical protein